MEKERSHRDCIIFSHILLIIFLTYVMAGIVPIISKREYNEGRGKSVLRAIMRDFRLH